MISRSASPLLRILGAVLTCVVALAVVDGVAVPVMAQGSERSSNEYTTKAKAAIVMDADTGAILYQVKADELMPPASMSKLMTVALAFKALKSGQVKLTDPFLMSEHAWRHGGAPSRTSAMMVPLNTRVTLDELLQGIIVQSGNDAAIAVAEGLGRSEDAFAKMMTEEARRIGLTKATFRNATGLYHPEHLMTVRELAILARHLIREYPEYYSRFSQKEFQYGKHKFINRNPILTAFPGADGLKTGHIAEAGYGLVASAQQDGKRLIAVLGGLPTENDRKEEGRKILEWGFKNISAFKIYEAAEVVGYARVWGGDHFYVGLNGRGDVSVILPRFPANQKLKGEIVYNAPLKPPIKMGDKVALLRVTSSSGASSEVALYAAEDVEPAGVVRKGLDSLAHLAESAVGMAFSKLKPGHSQAAPAPPVEPAAVGISAPAAEKGAAVAPRAPSPVTTQAQE